MRVRYRIDGVLQNRHAPALEYQVQLLTRVKVMAKLDIAEHRLPQDGRIKLRMGGREIDFRVSTVPIAGGERIVLRILDKGNVLLGFDKIGMLPDVLEQFKKLVDCLKGLSWSQARQAAVKRRRSIAPSMKWPTTKSIS